MEVFYKSSQGRVLDFTSYPYKMHADTDLFDYSWSYDTRNEINPKITRVSKNMVSRVIRITVSASDIPAYEKAVRDLLEILDRDVMGLSPGRLYVNDMYLTCYFMESHKTEWQRSTNIAVLEFNIVAEKGAWIKEYTTQFRFNGNGHFPDTGKRNLDYNVDLPIDFASGLTGKRLSNTGYFDTDFEITVYGACQNPVIYIKGYPYAVDCQLDTGEYLKINSITKKIFKVKVNGEVMNQFNLRSRDYYVFQRIPPGNSSVTWNGMFGFDITLLEERSEPHWI